MREETSYGGLVAPRIIARGVLVSSRDYVRVRACVRARGSERGEGEGKLFAMRRMSHRFGTVWGGRRGRGRGGGKGAPEAAFGLLRWS